MTVETIYGTNVKIPDLQEQDYIEDWGTNDPSEQYWRWRPLPDFFSKVEFDKRGELILTEEQEKYASEEVRRCKQGFWFYRNGKPTYITGKYYFYLQYWRLEDDIYPEYRSADRNYYLFLNHWENVLWCLGIFRGKKRREGASSQACANLIYECIFFKNSFCGLVSKTLEDSKDTFNDMVAFGYRLLPVFLKPRQLNKEDSVTSLVFANKIANKKDGVIDAINNEASHRSRVNFRAPVENAYDRGRISRGLWDEGGKWPKEVPFSKFIAKVSKTMMKGAKRVGFSEAPSTVNEMTKAGGAEFKKVWDTANQFKREGKRTGNRYVRYFTPAYEGYQGFIDKFGDSVVGEPTHEQYQYLVDKWVGKSELEEDDIKMGARAYLLSLREGLTGDELEEEIRQNPFDEDEMFMAANTDCVFNSFNIRKQIKYLEDNQPLLREVIFYRDMDQTIRWRDAFSGEKSFCWKILSFPSVEKTNVFEYYNNKRRPGCTSEGVIGVDGYSNEQGGRKYGSKASAWIFRKFNINDPHNTGLFIGHLYGRPATKDKLHEQILFAAEYYGYKVAYEHNSDDYMSYYRGRGRIEYLMRYPLNSIAPEKRAKAERHRGFPTTPFSLTMQMDTMVSYVEHYCSRIYFMDLLVNLLPFDPMDRTAYDTVVSAMITLVSSTEITPPPTKMPEPLIPEYD